MPAPHLLLTYDFPPIGGGIARWMAELARRYPERSLVVSTGQLDGAAEADALLPVPVDRVGVPARRLRTIPGLVRWSLRADRIARDRGATFTWCGNFRPAGYPARWIRRRRGVPYGIMLHGGELVGYGRQLGSARKRRVGRGILGDAAVLVTNSAFTRELTQATLARLDPDRPPPPIVVVHLGTDPARFRPGLDTSAVRSRFDVGPGRWLLTVARLTPHKGIDTALRVLARLAPRHPDLRYAVVGAGDDRARLEALAAELAVADRVRWLGRADDAHLPALYNCATAYLGLSRRDGIDVEGFGISLVEASGCGVPVIGGRSGGVPDAVREGETGLLVDPADPDAAPAAVARLLDDPDLARRLGQGGRTAVERYYSWDRVAADLRRLGDEAAARRGGP
jgi:phosphatidyl-myo-inositol dimannoside synthase